MKHYTHVDDISDLDSMIESALKIKKSPYSLQHLGSRKTLILLFFNASLRTRLSTELAARQLGMEVIVLNATDAWKLEFDDGTVMNAETSEHIREAAAVLSRYGDVIGIRAFPTLTDKAKDESEWVINGLLQHGTVPVINLESATGHPLQALADAITITEQKKVEKPKVVLSWAPHVKPLPHAVANSFLQMMKKMKVELSITHPPGADLNPAVTKGIYIFHDQEKALQDADFVYAKNWSSYSDYGSLIEGYESWTLTAENLGKAKFMHCLPVRRNLVVADAVLDGKQSLVLDQAENRTYAAQVVLKQILENL